MSPSVPDPSPRSVVLLIDDIDPASTDFLLGPAGNFEVVALQGEVDTLEPEIAARLHAIFVSMSDPVLGAGRLAKIRSTPGLGHLPVVVVVPPLAVGLADDLRRTGALVTMPPPAAEITNLEEMLVATRAASLRPARLPALDEPIGLFADCVRDARFDFRTVEEARGLAQFLAKLCPDPARQGFGLEELMLNAVEHGNLAIDGETKAAHIRAGTWPSEIERRLGLPEHADKRATVWLQRGPRGIAVRIRDCGAGFDWRSVIANGVIGTSEPNGRGVVLARLLSFDRLDYIDPGNEVIARVTAPLSRPTFDRDGRPARRSQLSSTEHMWICERVDEVINRSSDAVFFQNVQSWLQAEFESEAAAFGYFDESASLIFPAAALGASGGASTAGASAASEPSGFGELRAAVLARRELAIANRPFAGSEGREILRAMAAPIELRGELLGVVYVHGKQLDYDEDDRCRLLLIARQIAPALAVRLSKYLAAKNDALQRLQTHIHSEQVLASRVLAKVRQEGCLDSAGFRYVMSALDVFNGDIALGAWTPSGELRWLLGDFTGHGLGAAVGTIPIASIFYTTTRKGVALSETLTTLNDQLKRLLPSGLFCAGILLSLSADCRTLSVWNGAMPPVCVLSSRGERLRKIGSTDLPLGVVESSVLRLQFAQVQVEPGDEVLIFSDGLIEAADAAGERFGLARVEQIVLAASAGESFDRLLAGVAAFRGSVGPEDDVSLVEFTVGKPAQGAPGPAARASQLAAAG
jgi:hypothetical protein